MEGWFRIFFILRIMTTLVINWIIRCNRRQWVGSDLWYLENNFPINYCKVKRDATFLLKGNIKIVPCLGAGKLAT